MRDDGRWHVFARLVIPGPGAARGMSGPGGRIISTHDSEDEANKSAAELVKQLHGTVLEPYKQNWCRCPVAFPAGGHQTGAARLDPAARIVGLSRVRVISGQGLDGC
jgi:hypothetical protein